MHIFWAGGEVEFYVEGGESSMGREASGGEFFKEKSVRIAG